MTDPQERVLGKWFHFLLFKSYNKYDVVLIRLINITVIEHLCAPTMCENTQNDNPTVSVRVGKEKRNQPRS